MRKHFTFTPIVLLSTACAIRPYTPSLHAGSFAAEDVPAAVQTTLPAYSQVVSAWQLPPNNPWTPYCKLTLFTALEDTPQSALLPDVRELASVKAAGSAAAQLATIGIPDDAMWVVDLRGAASVAFGVYLSGLSQKPVSLVPTFNNWPAQNELIPAEETLSALVTMRPKTPDILQTSTRPVFLLDAWRLAFREEEPEDTVVDNRYALTVADLPAPEVLISQGVRRVIYVVEDRESTTHEEDDLNAVFLSYQQAGVTIDLVDLSSLFGISDAADLPVSLAQWIYLVSYRTTLIEDPAFYRRARGGFGGIYARPFRFGTNYSGGNHGGFHLGHGGG